MDVPGPWSALRQRVLAAWRAPGGWAVIDQGVVSVGNFVVAIAVARAVAPTELGAFGVLLGIIVTANAVHASLVGVPSMVLSGRGRGARNRVASVALLVTVLSLAAYASAVIAGVLLVDRPGLLGPALFALVGGVVQETLRRALMGRLEFRRAVWGDAVSYLGQATVVVGVASMGGLSVANAFVTMGATSLAGAVVQWRQVRPRLTADAFASETLSAFWRLGRALVVVNGIGAVTIYSLPWLLSALHGVRTVGSFQALLAVVSVANPLMSAANSLITTRVAHSAEDRSQPSRNDLRIARRYGALIGAPLAAYCAFLLVAPGAALNLFFGGDSPYAGLSVELRLLVGFSLALYVYFVLAGVFAGRQQTWPMLRAQLAAAATVGLAGIPLIALADLRGAVAAAGLSSLVRAAVAATARGTSAQAERG